jgi:hypothetical protein
MLVSLVAAEDDASLPAELAAAAVCPARTGKQPFKEAPATIYNTTNEIQLIIDDILSK